MSRDESSYNHSPETDPTRTQLQTMLSSGTVLAGRYRIEGIAGAGGMGVVYKAYDEKLEVEVALKLLGPELSADQDALARFRQEIRLSRQVTHPNVVRIHDIGQDGDLMFLTMDFVPGRTLRERLAEGPLAPEQATSIAIQLAEALSAAHAQNIIHRDIKPSNILVEDQGGTWLSDFGIARSLDQQGLTQHGTVIGTLAYLAPEQVRGEAVDARTDLYALGLVLAEMLTGEVPLKGETAEETAAQRATGQLPQRWPALDEQDPALRTVLRRCLASRPDDRYPDAAALLADLKSGHAAAGNRALMRTGGAVVIGLALVALLMLWQPWQPGPEDVAAGVETAATADRMTLAVLPIDNATGNATLDWVQRSLAESLAAALAESPTLQVTEPIRVSRALADLRLDPAELDQDALQQLAELFGVSQLVFARLIGAEQQLRLELQITSPTERSTAERIRIDTRPADLLAATDRAAAKIIKTLALPEPAQTATIPMSSQAEALAAFDAGIASLASGNGQRAVTDFERAVEIDPVFGLAWLRLAEAYTDSGYFDQALDASARAVELMDKHGGRASLWARAREAELSGQAEQAVSLFEQLVERYPRDTAARLALADLLANLGDLERAATEVAAVTEDDPNHPRAWFLRGKFAVMSGDVQQAVDDYFTRALVIQNRLSNPEGRAEVLNGLGIANERLGELDPAADYYQQANALNQQTGDLQGQAINLSNLARVNLIRGRYTDARSALERALEISEQIGDLPGLAMLYSDFGALEEELGNYPAALVQFRNALRLHEDLGNTLASATVRASLGFINLMLGEYDTSEAFIQRAIEAQREFSDEPGLMSSLQILGELNITQGEWETARQHLLEALEIARRLDSPFGEATVQGSIGRLAGERGRIGAALDALQTALDILEPLGDRRGLAEYMLRKAELMVALSLDAHAQQALDDARELFGDELVSQSQHARLLAARAALTGDQTAQASDLFRQAAELAEASGHTQVAVQTELNRLYTLDDELGAFEALYDRASMLNHRPLQLAVLTALAEKQLEADRAVTLRMLRQALRPPLSLKPWHGNWRLYALLAQTSNEPDAQAEDRARALFNELAEQTPQPLRQDFVSAHQAELPK